MKVIIVPGTLDFNNLGDTSMLRVAVQRIKGLFPGCTVSIITSNPQKLKIILSGTIPLSNDGVDYFCLSKDLLSPFNKKFKILISFEKFLKYQFPFFYIKLLKFRGFILNNKYPIDKINEIIYELKHSDLLLVSGMGGINEIFSRSKKILTIISFANSLKIPTALVGQGIGPFSDKTEFHFAKKILKNVKLIGIREELFSKPLLESFGLNNSVIHVTGDDAIELVYNLRSQNPGTKIGVGIRITDYSQFNAEEIRKIEFSIKLAANKLNVELVPIPILLNIDSNDLISFFKHFSSGNSFINIDTPEKVINLASSCRLIIASSYHAAVFSLAQGIPAIGIYKSNYYSQKLNGLFHQFGYVCPTIDINLEDFDAQLFNSIINNWTNYNEFQPKLLQYALDQVNYSKSAYEKLRNLVN